MRTFWEKKILLGFVCLLFVVVCASVAHIKFTTLQSKTKKTKYPRIYEKHKLEMISKEKEGRKGKEAKISIGYFLLIRDIEFLGGSPIFFVRLPPTSHLFARDHLSNLNNRGSSNLLRMPHHPLQALAFIPYQESLEFNYLQLAKGMSLLEQTTTQPTVDKLRHPVSHT